MKRYLISTVVILMALAVAWPVLGQREGRGGGQALSEEERTRLREKWQNMSEEERQKLRDLMRERTADRSPTFGREEQLKVIEDVEERLANLKAAIKEGPDREAFRKLREASPEQQAKLRKEWQKARREKQQMVNAIREQLTRLARPRPQIARLDLAVNELKAIHQMAIEEKATKTAERIEKLIARYQRRPVDQPDRPAKPNRPDEQQTRPRQGVEGTVSGNEEL